MFFRNPHRLSGLVGLAFFFALMCFLSHRPTKVNWRPVLWGFLLQFLFGILVLKWVNLFFSNTSLNGISGMGRKQVCGSLGFGHSFSGLHQKWHRLHLRFSLHTAQHLRLGTRDCFPSHSSHHVSPLFSLIMFI